CHGPMFVINRYLSAEERPWNTAIIERREKYCIAAADVVTTPSIALAQTVTEECGLPLEGIRVYPNPLDVHPFLRASQEREPSPAKRPLTILYVGRLDRLKGAEVLEAGAPLILHALPEARFIFLGGDRPAGASGTWGQRLGQAFRTAGVS